jgi:hypothetical protein
MAFSVISLIRGCDYLKCVDLRSDSNDPLISAPLSDATFLRFARELDIRS